MFADLTPHLWHALASDETIAKLQSSAASGITDSEAKGRQNQFGSNELPQPKRRSLARIFLHQFLSPLIYLLLVSACIALFVGGVHDAVVILLVVVLNSLIGAFQEGRAERSLEALRRLSKLHARIIRQDRQLVVEAKELVPGDLLLLNSGDAVCADARLVEVSALATAEAALTGESFPVVKSLEALTEKTPLADRRNMVYAGTHVTAGRGVAVVTATGTRTEIGSIAELARTTVQPKTQLETRIAKFGRNLVLIAITLFCLVIGIGLIRGISFTEIFMIAVSQMVSIVPEGLPVALTIALAVGVQRMARRGTVVRRLSAVETLGATTVICTDKTGTLTRNEITVTEIYLPANGRRITVTGIGHAPQGSFEYRGHQLQPHTDDTLQKLLTACVLCNDAQLLGPDDIESRFRILGDPTEGALLTLAAKGGIDPNTLRGQQPRVAELPFSSDTKMMATQHTVNGHRIVYIKGGLEAVLRSCHTLYHDGHIEILSTEQRQQIHTVAQEMADAALRVLAIGFVHDGFIDPQEGFKAFEQQITLVGLVGEHDPPRAEIAPAVRACKEAGIQVVMITGDHKATGVAIARAVGIYHDGDLAMDAAEMEEIPHAELVKHVKQTTVFARVRASQKVNIVEAFEKTGEVVAMTGDGVNDAPALMRADVGVAMGITGTEVAKEAAKIVITDDNFTTLVAAIEEGRVVYQNIKKLILFLFVTSLDEVAVLFLALVLGYPPPFAAVQILWINLVTEGALTINLVMEPAEGDEMQRPPTPPEQPLLDRPLLLRIPLMALTSIAATFGWFAYRSASGNSPALVQTETFTMLAVCQWFNVLNCRSATQSALSLDLRKNPWLLAGIALANVLHLMVVYWPPLGKFFHTVPIGAVQFIGIGFVASSVLWTEELRKWIVRR
jgi:magnesium-transporting ATPase (P-type)